MNVLNVKNLTIKYKNIVAVDNISFSVEKGEIFGIIGPNGAGKTSTLECIEGFRKMHAGEVDVLGTKPSNRTELFTKIGVQLQETKLQDNLKVIELIKLYASFYEKNADYNSLLNLFELQSHSDYYVKKLSGGQKQKLSIILALLGDPEILFLDEISTGLDPKARMHIWEIIEKLRDNGKTIIISTHFMEEAEKLCNRVMLMVKGEIKAIGTIKELIDKAKLKIILTLKVANTFEKKQIPRHLNARFLNEKVIIELDESKQIIDAINYFSNITTIIDIDIAKPRLEDLFLKLTGSKLPH